MEEFFKLMVPVLAANLITAMILFGFFRRYLLDKKGEEDKDPFLTLGPIILGCVFLFGGLFYYGAFN